MKCCKDCKHYRDRWFRKPLCGHPDMENPVSGKPSLPCGVVRGAYGACGLYGKLFDQAEPGVVRKSWIAVVRWIARLVGVPL